MYLSPNTQLSFRCEIQLAPIPVFEPEPGFVGMGSFRIPHLSLKQPMVEFVKRALRNHTAVVVGPAPNDRVEPMHDRQDVHSLERAPVVT